MKPELQKFADPNDTASHYEMEYTQSRVEHHSLLANKRETHPDFDGESCVDCGNEIPAKRLDMGKVRCTNCASALEFKGRMYGG